jgi:TatD DNase family protein
MAEDEKVVAIGECGLDYFRLTEETKALQQKVFKEHIKLASEIGKPLMIHCRNAFPDLISILQTTDHKLPAIPGIIHFMTGTKEDARELLALGFSFSFGGVLTFARDYDEVVRSIPLERILLETDAPYVAPAPYRGKRNEPAYVMESAKKIAEIKDVPFEDVARVTTENAVRMFGIDA